MEYKKLVKILLKDMGDLEEMISDMKNRGEYDVLDMEILYSRAKGIKQLLQLLNGLEPAAVVSKVIEQEKIEEEQQNETISPVVDESQNEPIEPLEKDLPVLEEEKVSVDVDIQEEEPDVANESKEEVVAEQPEEKIEHVQAPEVITEEVEPLENNSNDVELEEEEIVVGSQRLGDSFLKGKSVNDIITAPNKLEFKLSNRPVENIQSAIGINDRFQYIRELFDGSSEKFSQTVSELDNLGNITEAVRYLQGNFKWKKNETSLKFINLVKRRFSND